MSDIGPGACSSIKYTLDQKIREARRRDFNTEFELDMFIAEIWDEIKRVLEVEARLEIVD